MGNRQLAALVVALVGIGSCNREPASPPPSQTTPPAAAPAAGVDDADPRDDAGAVPTARSGAALAALMPSDATGCAPGARCLKVSAAGKPQATGTSIAQCRGEFADFIVPASTIPAGYAGPWFTPNLIENAHTGIPSGTRPWRNVDPRNVSDRLKYLLALRNYAFSSPEVRSLTPQFTADTDYFDAAGGTVPANQRTQKWYPAPRMIYPNASGSGQREAAGGMTLERRVGVGELGSNTKAFVNYAVAYYDARGARTYARTWSTATPGVDKPDVTKMKVTAGGMVYKLLFSAAKSTDFPTDILAGSVPFKILPATGGPLDVRLLQIDIAVKDDRAGATGWYFATYAYDAAAPGSSPWLKMVPVGLMWGNDPGGLPLKESWINPAAPAYAAAHLGVDGRLNGPVDNRVSACMSCHGTAQAPSLASMIPPAGTSSCLSQRDKWFRNLPGTQAFGRFDPKPTACETDITGITLTAADYSLQLGATVTRGLPTAAATFNPCTWDAATPPPPPSPSALTGARARMPRVFEVTRDPKQ